MSDLKDKVLKYFIKNSPVGELQAILKDLEVMCGKDYFEKQTVRDALREWYESHRYQLKLDDGRMVMVNEMWRQDPVDDAGVQETFVYFDNKQNVKFSFDPVTGKAKVQGETNDYPEQIDDQWGAYK